MTDERKTKIKRVSEIIKTQDDSETEATKLFAHALQAGYELGKASKQTDKKGE